MPYTEDYYQGRALHPGWLAEARTMRRLAGAAVGGRVVDLGCGAGGLMEWLGAREGVGIDANATAIDMARGRGSDCDYRLGDAVKPDLRPGWADCVVTMHLLEHLPSPAEALRHWRTLLGEGGKLIITTPNADARHPEAFDDPDHKHIFRGPELVALLKDCGYRPLKAWTLGLHIRPDQRGLWRLWPWAAGLRLPTLGPLRWMGQSLVVAAEKGAA